MRKILLLLLALSLISSIFVSCSKKKNDDGDSDGDAVTSISEEYLYADGSELKIVVEKNPKYTDAIFSLHAAFSSVMTAPPKISDSFDENDVHKVFVGRVDSELSRQAYDRLERLEHETEDSVGVVVMSDKTSLAIAYDDDICSSRIALDLAIKYIKENCLIGSTCAPERGVLYRECVGIIEYQDGLDGAKVEQLWLDLEEGLAGEVGVGGAAEIVGSLKRAYMLFDDDVIKWVASLYDPVIGGFYYSNSGRDTLGYLPDLESTYQILSFLGGTGMSDGLATAERIPDWMGEQISKFVKSLQDPVSGYFYHPQWGGENFADRRAFIDDDYVSRRGRDLKWAVSLLKTFGARPTYDTPLGEKGDGILADGTPVPIGYALTGRLSKNTVAAISKVMSTASEDSVPAHLRDANAMWNYLSGLNVKNDSYYVGNLLESQSNQITARDKVLDPSEKTTPIADAVKEFFDYHQNPKTGMWTEGDEITYDGVNGLLKISGVYNGIGKAIPNPIPALRSAMAGISIEEAPTTVCYVLNPWYAITNIFDNVRRYNTDMDSVEIEAAIRSLRSEILASAVELIDVTAAKTAEFVKDDGSFSYFPDTSGPNSQGVPVAVTGSREGDVNATYMFISGIPNHIFGILGYDIIPVFTTADRYRLWYEFENLGEIVKDEEIPPVPMDYEDDDLGTLPTGVTASVGALSTVGVENAERDGKTTKAVVLNTKPGSADTLRFPLDYYTMLYNAVIFEADMKIASGGGSGQIEMLPYGSQGDAYRMIFDYAYGGDVSVRTVNDFRSTHVAREGEWFKFRIEYAFADIDYDRNGTKDLYVKVYVNGVNIATGYTPATSNVLKAANVSGVRFFSWTAADASLYVDNVIFKQGTIELQEAPKVNPEDNAEKITFEESFDDNIPGKIGTSEVSEGGKITIINSATSPESDKVLSLHSPEGYTDALKFYMTRYSEAYNSVAFDADIRIAADGDAGKLKFAFITQFSSTASLLEISYVKGGDVTLSVPYGDSSHTAVIAKEGEWFRLRIEYTATTRETLTRIYVGGTPVLEFDLSYNYHHNSSLINTAKLTVESGAAVSVMIDDVVLEQLLILKPDGVDSEKGYGFSDGTLPEIALPELADGSSLEVVSDVRAGVMTKSLKLHSPKGAADTVAFSVIDGSEETDTVVFEADIKISDSDGDNSFVINHVTEDGRIANQLIFGYSISSGNVFAQNKFTVGDTAGRDFSTVLVSEGYGSYFNLRIEYRKINDSTVSTKIYINGTEIASAESVTPYSRTAIPADEISAIEIETYSAKALNIFFDNVVIERVTAETPAPVPPEVPGGGGDPGDSEGGDVFDGDGGSIIESDIGGNVDDGSWTQN